MTFFQAFLLGAIQGITEFLPISSSAHVAVASKLLNFHLKDNVFDVFLNMGSVLAVMVFFRQHMFNMFYGFVDFIGHKKTENRYFFMTIFLSSLPVVFVFGMLEIILKISINSTLILSAMLILFAIVLYFCDQNPTDEKNISRKNSILVGFAQTLSFVQGVIRLGSCLSMMRYLHYSREESFRYSMVLSVPPVFGACFVKLMKVFTKEAVIENWSMVAVGSISSFVFGLISLTLMVKFLQKHTLLPMIIYRILFGLFVLAYV
jgi:undecaprenyl-diphosphatase